MQGQLWRNAKYFLFLTPVILSPVFMAMGAAVLLGSYLGRLGPRGKSWRDTMAGAGPAGHSCH